MTAIRHIHLNPIGGMAGDMFAAALLDAMPDLLETAIGNVMAVLPKGHPRVLLEPCSVSGLRAQRFCVPAHEAGSPAGFTDMSRLIETADIGGVRRIAAGILATLARAEASIHGVSIEDVHFHEIADWDTLADVTAAATVISGFPDASWSFEPFPLGGGRISTAHGVMPVPAPATALLLEGVAVHDDGIAGERVTPTGAAIVRYLIDQGLVGPRAEGRFGTTGYGAGTRTLEGVPNVVVAQLTVAHSPAAEAGSAKALGGRERIGIIEFEVDDMSGEEIAVANERLRLRDDVLDLSNIALTGKKGRPAVGYRILTRPDAVDAVAEACFCETSTIGLRTRIETRLHLRRTQNEIEIEGQTVGVKRVERPGGFSRKAESDDIASGPTLNARRTLARKAESDE